MVYDKDDGRNSTITFNCAEQFMMYCKPSRFSNRDTQKKVLATDSSQEHRRLSKLTASFDDASWDEVVVAGKVAKFGQNPKLGRKLLSTGNRPLVEAASLGKARMTARAQLREKIIIRSTDVKMAGVGINGSVGGHITRQALDFLVFVTLSEAIGP
ncbi:hypothetical protein GGS21DRAFT_544685 [Xylaria nigripes]|nr:hypothetical protein GGS21DRAFT_544685 [Xylaria nigripes]